MIYFMTKAKFASLLLIASSIYFGYPMQETSPEDPTIRPFYIPCHFELARGFCTPQQNFLDHLQALRSFYMPITFLDVGGTEVDDEQLNRILRICGRTLMRLNLCGCENLHNFDFVELTPNLKQLNVEHTNITIQQIESLFENLPVITIIEHS